MTGTNHGMTGAVIALLVREPLIAVPLSFISHLVCDAIPHFGFPPTEKVLGKKFNRLLAIDFVVAILLMIVIGALYPSARLRIWACMAAAASPDIVWAYYYLYLAKIKRQKFKFDPVTRFLKWIQWSETKKGAYVEVVWFLVMGALVIAGK